MISDFYNDLVGILAGFLKENTSFLFRCEPEIIDFRNEYSGDIVLVGKNGVIKFKIPDKLLTTFVGVVSQGIFGAGNTIYSWDIKRFFSYLYFRVKHVSVMSTIVDIKYGEAFLGISNDQPKTYDEAVCRGKTIIDNNQCWKIHHSIHIPLATRILPKIETTGILDIENKIPRYASYDIEGQVHGRFRCRGIFDNALLIHNLTQEDKNKLKPKNNWITADFKAMEVFVLQYLSKDKKLGKIIESGRDIYSTIYSLLFGSVKCTESQRQIAKRVFLPVVYGLKSNSMAETLGISKNEADAIISNIYKHFQEAIDWVDDIQKRSKLDGKWCDYFGRVRVYDNSVRNGIIQSPAAIVCQEKLITLCEHVNVVANIHDAYILDAEDIEEISGKVVSVLEESSKLMPGLKMRVGIKNSL